jgi:hypothetical protein
VLDSHGLIVLIPGGHDYEEIDVALGMGPAIGMGSEQDDLVGMEVLGDSPRVPTDQLLWDALPQVHALRRKREGAFVGDGHTRILRHGLTIRNLAIR